MRRIISIVTALFMLLGLFVIDIPTSAEDAWVSIYANYIGSSSFDTENTQSLLLADLNVDGTPELLRLRMGGGMGETVMQPMTFSGSSIMTCSGSNAVYLGYLIQKISINLYRKDNRFVWVIVVDCPTDSIGSDFIHKVFEISMNGKTVKAVGRFELRGTQSGGRVYYRDGKKVSKSTYTSAHKSYFRKLKSMNMSAVEGNPNAWHENAAAVRISAFNAMVSQYRSEMQNAIPVTKVSLNKTKIPLALGRIYLLKASVSPSYALNKALTWRSDNTSVATVSGGTVKAIGYGTAKITATAPSGKYGTCTVTVPRPAATKVTIITIASEVYTGSSLQLAASVSPSAASQTVTWTSSNKSVATIDSKGLVKGQKPGTTTITAKTSNGKKAYKTIRVKAAVEVTGVSVSPATVSVEAGKTKQLSATVQPSNATDKTLTWSSSDTSVATVNSAGLVSAKKVGSATITAKAKNGVYNNCKVTVTAAVVPVTSVIVSPATGSVQVGKTKQLTATVQPSNATDKTLAWSSNDTSVATVSSTGLITAKKAGTATITAKAKNGVNGTCKVTVTAAEVLVTSVSVSPTNAWVEVGRTRQLSATVLPSNATNKALTWTSSNTSVATVSASGLVAAKKAGTATITAKANNGVYGTSIIYVGTGSKTGIAEGVYNIKNSASGLMLDVAGSGSADHTNVQVFPSHTGNNQRWIIRNGGSDVYTLTPMHATSAALDVSTGVMQPGQNIQIYHQNQTAAQKFCFYKEANGSYTIRPNVSSGLAVQAASTTAESNVALGSYSIGNMLQQWSLVKVADIPTPGGGYNPALAAQFAHENWNKDPGTSNMCARFVSRCLIAGGIQMTEIAGTGPLASYLKGLGKQMDVVSLDELKRTIKTGDVICFWWKDNTGTAISHVAICCGRDCGGGDAGVPWLCAWTSDRHYQVSRMASAARQIAIIRMS